MHPPNTHRKLDAEPIAAADDEETATLPSLSLAANEESNTAAIDQINANLDKLISLGQSINEHLEYLVRRQKRPAWAPRKTKQLP